VKGNPLQKKKKNNITIETPKGKEKIWFNYMKKQKI